MTNIYTALAAVMAEPCVIWTGRLREDGYGTTGNGGYAHRAAYENAKGPIPEGLHIDHLCRNHSCVNPSHLEAVTQAENNRRASLMRDPQTGAWLCRRGHNLSDPANVYAARGRMECRPCRTLAVYRYRARKVAAHA